MEKPEGVGGAHPTLIAGATFVICTERLEGEDAAIGRWHAWSFFVYDRGHNIYPAGMASAGVRTRESIAGGSGQSEREAIEAVKAKLMKVIESKDPRGTGFYSPPANAIYPQQLPPDEEFAWD